MFTRLWNWVRAVEQHELETILSEFYKAKDKLEGLITFHNKKAAEAQAVVKESTDKVNQATTVLNNVNKLLGQ